MMIRDSGLLFWAILLVISEAEIRPLNPEGVIYFNGSSREIFVVVTVKS